MSGGRSAGRLSGAARLKGAERRRFRLCPKLLAKVRAALARAAKRPA